MKFIFLLLIAVLPSMAERPEIPPWEAHGQTLREWMVIDSLDIPLSRIDSITAIGVSLKEYLFNRWILYGVDFKTWYKLRRSGKDEAATEREIKKYKWRYIKPPKRRTFSKGIE